MTPHRRARLATLDAVYGDPGLGASYALEGGLVLREVFGSPRPSYDVDLAHVRAYPHGACADARETLLGVIDALRQRLAAVAPRRGLTAATVDVERWSDRLATVHAWVRTRAASGEAADVEVQATLCEPACHPVRARIGGVEVLAQGLEDVTAAKLQTLLQQADRGKVRHADAFDLWYAVSQAPLVVAPEAVRACLLSRLALWPSLGAPTPGRFRQRPVVTFAEQGHRTLRAEHPELDVPPFDEAWRTVLAFVDAMGLPDG